MRTKRERPTRRTVGPQDWRLQPTPLLRRCAQAVRSTVRRHGLWHRGDRLLVAVSGGADSLALLLLLDWLAPSLGHTILVGHIDHGLQPDRAEAEALLRAACASLDVPCHVVRCAVQRGAALEGRCRDARYAALQQLRRDHDCAAIVTAHHAADQAETLLMRMARGAGLDALQGVRALRDDHVVRPLLQTDPADLHALLAQRPHWTDPSNTDPQHTRNRIRATALPALERALPRATAGLARTATHLSGFEQGAAHFVAEALRPHLRREGADLLLDAAALPADPPAWGILVRWMTRELAIAPLGEAAVNQLSEGMQKATCREVTVSNLRVSREGHTWRWRRIPATA